MQEKSYAVYILASRQNTAIYTGVTSDLKHRVFQHRSEVVDGFSKRYHTDRLVYFEITGNVLSAIDREKQIKSWSRKRKNDLIGGLNPEWRDLYDEI